MPEENAKDKPQEEQLVDPESEGFDSEAMQEDEPEATPDVETELQEAPQAKPQPSPPSPEHISPSSEHNWAMIAHLSILLNIFTVILGPVVAFIIYLVYKDRSRYIAYQSLQSMIFQLITWVGTGLLLGVIWLITAALSIVLIGLLCIPFAFLGTILLLIIPFAALIYGVIAGIKCSQGEDFKYWLVGDWVRSTYEGE